MKKIETLIEKLKKHFNERLTSVILYGKYAEESANNHGKIHLIIILDKLHASDLKTISPSLKKWKDEKHALPVFMDVDNWQESADTYPMEYLDILTRNKILYGKDIVSAINVKKCDLRHQCEYELYSFLFYIREMYVENTNPKAIEEILRRNFSRVVKIAKTILYLLDEKIPEQETDIIMQIAEKCELDKDLFLKLIELTHKRQKLNEKELENTIQNLIDAFNGLLKYVDKMEICT